MTSTSSRRDRLGKGNHLRRSKFKLSEGDQRSATVDLTPQRIDEILETLIENDESGFWSYKFNFRSFKAGV